MAGVFTNANANYLTQKLGRSPSEGELYIAHFLGAGGAARLISLAAANPNAKATDYFANAAHANSSIFYDRSTGATRSLAEVRNVLTARYDVARSTPNTPAPAAASNTATNATALSIAPDTAGIANAFAAATPPPASPGAQVFHGLFQDSDRTGPVASLVRQLWGVPDSRPGSGPSPSPPGGTFDLFKDNVQG